MRKDVEKLLGLLREITGNTGRSWQEKRDLILEECGEAEKTALEEFCAWFEPSDKAGDGVETRKVVVLTEADLEMLKAVDKIQKNELNAPFGEFLQRAIDS